MSSEPSWESYVEELAKLGRITAIGRTETPQAQKLKSSIEARLVQNIAALESPGQIATTLEVAFAAGASTLLAALPELDEDLPEISEKNWERVMQNASPQDFEEALKRSLRLTRDDILSICKHAHLRPEMATYVGGSFARKKCWLRNMQFLPQVWFMIPDTALACAFLRTQCTRYRYYAQEQFKALISAGSNPPALALLRSGAVSPAVAASHGDPITLMEHRWQNNHERLAMRKELSTLEGVHRVFAKSR